MMKGPKKWAIFLALCLASCSPRIVERVVTVTVTEVRDSTAWRDTTVYVPIPLESDQAIVHIGDTSHRETSVAESDAWIGKDGMLHHSLRNKSDARIAYYLKLPEHWLYTGVTNTKEHGIIKEVPVEKPLSWGKRAKIGLFWWLVLAVVGLAGWTFRKPIGGMFTKLCELIFQGKK